MIIPYIGYCIKNRLFTDRPSLPRLHTLVDWSVRFQNSTFEPTSVNAVQFYAISTVINFSNMSNYSFKVDYVRNGFRRKYRLENRKTQDLWKKKTICFERERNDEKICILKRKQLNLHFISSTHFFRWDTNVLHTLKNAKITFNAMFLPQIY